MGKQRNLQPSLRGLRNLQPNLMFDLERVIEKVARYDPETQPDGLIDISSSLNVLMVKDVLSYSSKYILLQAQNSIEYGSTAGSPKLLSALSSYVNTYFQPSSNVAPSDIIVTNGATSLLSILAFNLCDPGEGIMYAVPNYGMLAGDLSAQNGLKIIEVQTPHIQDRFASACADTLVQSFKVAFTNAQKQGIRVRALVICNPCNPLGRCYSRVTLVKLARFCSKYDLHLVSDEIYAMSVVAEESGVYDSNTGLDSFTSVLSLTEEDGAEATNIHCISGASKDFGLGGLRLGFLVTKNELLWKTVRKLCMFTWISAFSDNFFATFLSDVPHVEQFFHTYHLRLKAAYDQATTFLDQNNITYNKANAGLFLWIDLSPWLRYVGSSRQNERTTSLELQLTYYLIQRGVYLEPGEAFSCIQPGRFRFVYTGQVTETLDVALRRLSAALKDLELHSVDDDSDLEDEKLKLEYYETKDTYPKKRGRIQNVFRQLNCFRSL